MLPSLIRIVASMQMIRTGAPAVQLVLDDVRSTALLDAPADDPRETRRTPLRHRLDVEDVTYRYPGSEATVLDRVSLSVAAGTSVALVGVSGAGKTTLVDVVLGLHQPEHGRVLTDGVPIDDDLAAWQRSIGLVPQDVYLIDDTLRANIALGEPDEIIDDQRLTDAVRMAQLDEHVATLPDGLATKVGERGDQLSAGERQLVALLRAGLAGPDVLILDEATSSVDALTEVRVARALERLAASRTTIAIAHRLSTAARADRVLVLEHGRLVEDGHHADLLAAGGVYARMYDAWLVATSAGG